MLLRGSAQALHAAAWMSDGHCCVERASHIHAALRLFYIFVSRPRVQQQQRRQQQQQPQQQQL